MPTKPLFKYRSLEQMEFLLDIFANKRLFAADYQSLNDPMEGVFTYSKEQVARRFIMEMMHHKQSVRICSLSKSPHSTLMWSYYADAHQGVAIGVEVNEGNLDLLGVNPIQYTDNVSFEGFYGSQPETEAINVLSKKLSPWQHEQEVRVFSRSSFVPVKITSVHYGYRMPPERRELIEKVIKSIDPSICHYSVSREELDTQRDSWLLK
jgi:hypothetical protein